MAGVRVPGRHPASRELNRIFGYLRGVAALVALHRNMLWRTAEGLQLDSEPVLCRLAR